MSQLPRTLQLVLESHGCDKYDAIADGEAICECEGCDLAGVLDEFLAGHELASCEKRAAIKAAHFPAPAFQRSAAKDILRAFYRELHHMRLHPQGFFKSITVFRMDCMGAIIESSSSFCEKQKTMWRALIEQVHNELQRWLHTQEHA
jgi:hypothetical protein